jgi:ubiquinone/menaquinone biosynthesis C-methylase UbiE
MSSSQERPHRLCPASQSWVLSIGLRRLIHNPEKILSPYIRPGQTVLDVGPGPGYFTIAMARMVGDQGKVIAADLQQEMLDKLAANSRKAGLESRIQLHLTQSDSLGVSDEIDFALAFAVVHEVPDAKALLQELYQAIKPGGSLLVSEPSFHVSESEFNQTIEQALQIGFRTADRPRIALSRSIFLVKD